MGARFSARTDRPWGPSSLLYNGYWVFPGGKERPGREADPSPPSSAVGHERVELYLYSLYGPYGLYTVTVPVQGYTYTVFLKSIRFSALFHSLFSLSIVVHSVSFVFLVG